MRGVVSLSFPHPQQGTGITMRPFTRSWLALLSLVGGLIVPCLCAADESAGDLQPIAPLARSLFTNQFQFRNFGMGNGTTQVMSRDGKTLLMVGNNGLMVWDVSGRRDTQPRTLNPGIPNLYNAAATLSADGKTAALVPMYQGGDMAVRFFDTDTGKQTRDIENDEQIFGLALSPDSRLLAVSTRQRIELWNAEDGEEVRVSPAGQNVMYRLLTFSPDGKMLAAIGQEPNTVHIWEVASLKERESVHLGGSAASSQVRGRRRVFVPPGGNPNTGILALAFSSDSRLLAASTMDSTLHLWDLQANREAAPLTGFRGNVVALVFPSDGKELIAMDSEGTRLTWRMAAIRRSNQARLAPLSDAEFAELWTDLAEPDLFRAYRARRHLVADPKRALPLLAQNVKPVPPGDTARIKELMKELTNANAGQRRKAMTELRTKHGEAALGALMQVYGTQVNQGAVGGNAGIVLLQKLNLQFNTPERARDIKAVQVLEEIGTPEARAVLEKLSKGAAGVGLTTEAKAALERLSAAAPERPRETTEEQLWADLASDDAGRAFRAMCGLSAKPEQAVALFRKRLKPVPIVEEKEIAAHIANLEAEDFKTREEATKELEKVGEQALPVLKKALDAKPSLEARKRMERLVEQATGQASAPLLRGLRAVEVLEHSGTADSKHVLVALAGGAPNARLTREAKASLQRLTR
jgi:hypothetical protein